MQKYLDWATFIKLDNAMTIDFLSSLAGTLADQGHFPSRELTQMKQALANRSVGWSKDEKSIVCSLMEEKSDALAALKIRYGTEGLSLNHTRFALKPLISDLINGLTLWADLILKKSELVFNRPFFVHNDHGIERRELFSQVLFATSQSLFDAVTDLRRAINEISTMRPSIILDVSGDFETIDSIVALQMGFSTIDDMGSFSRAESRALGRLGFALTELSTGITKINDYLIFNCLPSEDIMNTAVYCELLAAEVKRFSGLVFPDAGSTVAWEMRRQSICFSLYTVNQLISSLSATSSHSIVPLEEKNWQKLLSKDVGGRLTAEMFSSGVLLSDACAASQSLLAYCNQHQTEPSKLIPAELKKIHPILGTKTLDLLILLTSPSISATPGGSPLKARIITGTQRIRKGLNSLTPFAAPFSAFLLGVSISTCGVKTGLQSDAPDVRPEIPFYPLKPATLSLGEGPKSKSGVKVLDQKVRPNANSE